MQQEFAAKTAKWYFINVEEQVIKIFLYAQP